MAVSYVSSPFFLSPNLICSVHVWLQPIMSQIHKQVNGSPSPSESSPDNEKETEKTLAQENHDPALLQVLARELDCDVKDIYDFELFVLFHTIPVNSVGKLTDWEIARR